MTHALLSALSLALLASLCRESSAAALTPVRVAFLTDCKWYSDWQSIGMIYSFKKSGQPGKITRVMCCSDEDRKKYPADLLKEVHTHVAPSFTMHPITHDNYAAYNKPEAVIDWLQHVTPEEQYILVLDSDMILRRPFLVEEMKPQPGLAVGAKYTYMIGVNNELAMRHVPEIAPRNDTLAGPYGRRGDQVGGFFLIHRDDLKRMSTLWLKYTEDVRADPMAYKYSGDAYAVKPGDKPWISEMYGYAFGAAKADVWHTWDANSMIYPQYEPHGIPKLMHYGLLFKVNDYKFKKHWHYDFDITKCPPWNFNNQNRTGGLFEQPPHFSTLKNQNEVGLYYRDLLSIETVATMNAGFCDYHVRHCPPSEQLLKECKKASEFYIEVTTEVQRLESTLGCVDLHVKCQSWMQQGECKKNKEYMTDTCKKSCGVCITIVPVQGLAPIDDELERNLLELEKKLRQTAGNASPVAVAAKAVAEADAAKPGKEVADPDSKATTASPSPEQSPALPPPPPSPSSAPLTSPSPAVQPSASPIVIQAPSVPLPKAEEEVVAVAQSSPAIAAAPKSLKSRKELVVACYRMPLTLDEVKNCIKAAQNGEQYQRHALKGGAKAGADEVLTETADVVGADPTIHIAALSSHKPGAASALYSWQVTFSVLLLVAGFLIVIRRLLRLRRRPRSGMRSE